MIFEPLWQIYLKRTAVVLAIACAYLWVSADEYEFEQEQIKVTEQLPTIPLVEEEPDDTVQPEPVQHNGWIVPPEPVRKGVAKVKRKIKKTVKNGG
jgi:hypothetical protein